MGISRSTCEPSSWPAADGALPSVICGRDDEQKVKRTSSPPPLFRPFFFGVGFGTASSALASSTSLPEFR